MKKPGFLLIDIIIGLGLLGLLAVVIHTSIATSAKSIRIIENRSVLLDNCQRVAETLKVPSEENNEFFLALSYDDGFMDYPSPYAPENTQVLVRLDEHGDRIQTYTVMLKGEDSHVELVASRILK
ncbi:hypothetical protein [Gudongella sp. DL1XJH-153]|uniref:hypothetical protein n=1 Tax=Gudongella sp. DL1XJH-153 TaxID=3409804 RepID=UPI003BB77C68